MISFALAALMDGLFGDPVYKWHPVRLMGRLITRVDRDLYVKTKDARYQLVAGGILVLAVLLTVGLVYGTVLLLVGKLYNPLGIIVQALLIYQLLATRCLYDEGVRIRRIVSEGDLDKAREEIGYLVSRNTESLSFDAIRKAAVETLTENLTDAIVAPMIFYGLFGLVGLAVYKAINTMDSMIGYKNERYLYFGRVAARLDDVVNFIPARLTAGIIMVLAWIFRDDVRASFKSFMAYRNSHSSPNAGCTEAAMAGALGIALSGPTLYFGQWVDRPWIGDQRVPIEGRHLKKVLVYVIGTGCISVFITLGLVMLRMRWF